MSRYPIDYCLINLCVFMPGDFYGRFGLKYFKRGGTLNYICCRPSWQIVQRFVRFGKAYILAICKLKLSVIFLENTGQIARQDTLKNEYIIQFRRLCLKGGVVCVCSNPQAIYISRSPNKQQPCYNYTHIQMLYSIIM